MARMKVRFRYEFWSQKSNKVESSQSELKNVFFFNDNKYETDARSLLLLVYYQATRPIDIKYNTK